MDINARLESVIAKRKAAGLQIWFVGEMGEPVAINCATEESRSGYLASLRTKGRTILSDGTAEAA